MYLHWHFILQLVNFTVVDNVHADHVSIMEDYHYRARLTVLFPQNAGFMLTQDNVMSHS